MSLLRKSFGGSELVFFVLGVKGLLDKEGLLSTVLTACGNCSIVGAKDWVCGELNVLLVASTWPLGGDLCNRPKQKHVHLSH